MPNYSAGSADVEIKPDFRGFVNTLRAELDLVDADLSVDIHPVLTGFAEELKTELEAQNVKAEVGVGVDDTSLEKLKETIEAKLASMDLRVDVQVGADTRVAAAELAGLKAAYREMTMRVDADTSAAAAQMAALNGIPITANIRGSRSGLLSSLGPLTLNAGVLGLAALPAAGTAIASIGVSIGELSRNAALLPAIFAGAAAGITTMAIGFDGLKDAFGDDPKKAAAAYREMTDEGRALVDTARSFGGQWDSIRSRVQSITLAGLSEPLDRMLTAQLPGLDRGLSGMAGKLNEASKIALGELGNEKSTSALDKIFGNTTEAAGNLNGAVAPIISSFRTLAGTGSTFLPQLAQGFTNAATKLDAFLTRAEQSGDLARWMQGGIDAGKNFLSILGSLGSSLGSILRAAKGDGEGFLVTTDRLTEKWATFLKSTEGQAKLRAFFAEGREQMDHWIPILKTVGSGVGAVFQATQAWSAVLMPFLQAGSDLLSNHGAIVKTLLVSYLAYRTIGPIFTVLSGAIAGATARITAFGAASAGAAAGGAGALGRSMAGLGAAVGTGGLGLALSGAALGLGWLITNHQEAKRAADEQREALDRLGQTLDKETGKLTEQTIEEQVTKLQDDGDFERAKRFGFDIHEFTDASTGQDQEARDRFGKRLVQETIEGGRGSTHWEAARNKTGLSDEDIARALHGSTEAVEKFEAAGGKNLQFVRNELSETGKEAAALAEAMNSANGEIEDQRRKVLEWNAAKNGQHVLTEEGARVFRDYKLAVESVPDAKTVIVRANTEEELKNVRELGGVQLPDKSFKITLDAEQAHAQIAEVTKPRQLRIDVLMQGGVGPLATTKIAAFDAKAQAEAQPKALGGPITGGIPGQDSVPILAMPGEHMLTRSDVTLMGGQEGVYRWRAALQAGHVRPMAKGGAVEPWGKSDDIQLEQAQIAVGKAQEKLDELGFDKKATPTDRREAELAIEEARLRVQELEDRKAGRGGSSGPSTLLLPQAPLIGRRSGRDLDLEDADAAVDQANTKRNQVYANPAATDEDRKAADRDYQRAQNSRSDTRKTSSDGSEVDISLPGIAAKGAGILAEGILSGLGLENSILSGGNVYTSSLNSILGFYSNRDKTSESGDYDYTPKNLPVESQSESGTSTGTGGATQSAENYTPSGGAEQWRPTFTAVLGALGMPADWITLGLAQMDSESGGNPKAINLWDSNAQAGIPSKGLMQVIDPTFASNRSGLYPNDIWDPAANIAASLRYMVGRYTTPVGVWGEGHGYKDGGWVRGIGGPRDDLTQIWASPREFVVHAAAAERWGPELEAINAGLPLPPPPPPPTPPLPKSAGYRGGNSSVTHDRSIHLTGTQVADPRDIIREFERHQAFEAQGYMAGMPG